MSGWLATSPRVVGAVTALAMLGLAGRAAAQQPPQLRLVTPEGHTDAVFSAAFSPDGRVVVTASGDGTARLWEVASGRELQVFRAHTGNVNSAAFSPDGQQVVTAGSDSTARVWEVASGRELQEFRGDTDAVNSAAYSPDGRRVVTASVDGTVRVWEVADGRELQVFRAHTGNVSSAAFSPNGYQVVSAGWDETARVWDVASARELQVFRGHRDGVISAAFSVDGRQVVTAGNDGTARVWDVASGRALQVFRGRGTEAVTSAAFSRDGRRVLTASEDSAARVWDVASGRELQVFRGHTAGLTSAAFSPDGRQVVTASRDQTTRVWEVAGGRVLRVLRGHAGAVWSEAFSPDGREIVAAGWDSTARVWEVASGRELQVFRGHTGDVNSAAFSPDGRQVVTASWDGTARVWEVGSGRQLQVFRGHTGGVRSAAFSPDGRQVVTTGVDGTARVWEIVSGRQLMLLQGRNYCCSATFSPDGRHVAAASGDSVSVWEVASRREIQVFGVEGGSFGGAAFSPDGNQVLTVNGDWTASVWEVASGQELQVFKGHGDGLSAARFSPDGLQVVTASIDGTARVWDVVSGHELRVFWGESGWVESAAFSPDGRRVVTASVDRTTRMWDVETGAELFRRFVLDSGNWVAVAPDGRFDGTEGGMHRLYYARGLETVALEAFFEKFYTPGLTGLVVAGTPYGGPDIRRGFGTPPSVRILAPQSGDTVASRVTVVLAVTDEGGGAEDVRVYANGALLASTARGAGVTHSGCPAGALCVQVELLPGTNTLEATAFSSARIEAERARVTVTVPGARPTSTLHLLVVGINRYENPRYDLNYGRADAKAFADSVRAGAGGIFAQVVVDTLYDTAATGLAIKAAFRRVAAAAQPQDVFVFYYAGHGMAEQVGDSMRFYLVPSDVTQMSDPEQLAQHAVSNLRDLLDAVSARKKLMLIDACQSGEVLQAFGRGAAEEQAIARLAWARGVFVMAAAGSDQAASEVPTLGHGVFTYAWLQALGRDASGPRERLVGALASEVERTIPQLSRQYGGQLQHPMIFANGQDFPLVVR